MISFLEFLHYKKMFMPSNKRIISASQAILEATDQFMKKNSNLVLIGEGINDPKGIFGTTSNLSKKYSKNRVIESPISENGITGIAIGLAINNFKVLLVHQRVEFALLSVEQIFNNAAKSFYVTNGIHKVPLVIRMVIGRGWGQGPAHSQSLETVFSCIPGLKVLIPSSAYDAKGMLISALQDPNPVLILEHRWFHYVTGNVPKKIYKSDITKPKIISKGKEITVVTSSYNVYEIIFCSEILKNFNINLEIIDLRVLRPLNTKPIVQSVKKTRKLIIFETGNKIYGIGAEIIASILEKYHDIFDSPPSRIGLPDSPTPSSRGLAKVYYPNSMDIMKVIIKQLNLNIEVKKKIINLLISKLPSHEVDVPNPKFKGPF